MPNVRRGGGQREREMVAKLCIPVALKPGLSPSEGIHGCQMVHAHRTHTLISLRLQTDNTLKAARLALRKMYHDTG